MVNGRILTLKTDEIFEAGKKAGFDIGKQQGIDIGIDVGAQRAILSLIRDNTISKTVGAARLNMSITDLEIALNTENAAQLQ